MGTLLVVGAINTDLIAYVERAPDAGETVAGGHFEQHGGGKGANQAVAAARSGASVVLLSAVGDDAFGTAQLKALAIDDIDLSGVATIDSTASGVAIIIVEAGGENRICDLPGAREHLTPAACIGVVTASEPSAILIANELPFDCMDTIFSAARASDIPVWFSVAPFSASARDLIPRAHTVIANRGEAEDILGLRGENLGVDALATGIRDLGAANVIITLGSDGVQGFADERPFHLPAEPVTPVDTTGAGDTFCGAWAAAMMTDSSFGESLAYATRAAAISVTRRGAQSSIPTRDEILRK